MKVVAGWPKAVKRDEYKVVLPCGHPLAERERIDIHELDGLPFLLLEHGGKTEVTELLEKSGVHPKIRFTTWEDYAIMAMAERGLGIGILPELILQRIPYRIEIRPLVQPYYRQIGLAMKDRRRLSPEREPSAKSNVKDKNQRLLNCGARRAALRPYSISFLPFHQCFQGFL